MQYKVPQNIDLADKVIGPLTMIQFLYLLAGGVVIYLVFNVAGPGVLFYITAIPVGALSLGLAFLKIQDQPLMHFITAGFIFYLRPKQRIWQRFGSNIITVRDLPKAKKEEEFPAKKSVNKSELEKLAYTLDTHNPAKSGN